MKKPFTVLILAAVFGVVGYSSVKSYAECEDLEILSVDKMTCEQFNELELQTQPVVMEYLLSWNYNADEVAVIIESNGIEAYIDELAQQCRDTPDIMLHDIVVDEHHS